MGTKQKAQIEQLISEKQALEQKVSALDLQIKEAETKHKEEFDQTEKEWEGKLNVLKEEHGVEISERDEKIEELEEENKDKQLQIDKRELKKLAEAYHEQEREYKTEADGWLKRLYIIAGVLFLLTLVSIFITHSQPWLESIKYYVVDIVIFSAVWFCGSQYSNATKLRYDYANRKTLAQSFSNILNNLSENPEIKDKFIEKTTDVLCAPSTAGDKEPLLSKKIVKDLAEIIGAATKK